MLGNLTKELIILVCAIVPFALASKWSICPLASNSSTIKPLGIFSEIACAVQCDRINGCNAITWTRASRCELIVGSLRLGPNPTPWLSSLSVRNKSDCVTNVSLPLATPLTFALNCPANATSFSTGSPPCRAFAPPGGGVFQTSQPWTTIPEWWYPLNQSCIISHFRVVQTVSNQILAMYVLSTLASPRDTNSLCYLQQTTVATSSLLNYTCRQFLVGNFLLLTRATSGSITIWGMEIYGLPLN